MRPSRVNAYPPAPPGRRPPPPAWYPPPARPSSSSRIQTVVAAVFCVLATIVGLGVFAAFNYTVNVPVISPVVCAIKGGDWEPRADVAAGVPSPGCYEKSTEPSLPTPDGTISV